MSIKVLVVDDSAFMRKIIKDILNEDTEIEVIATAKNGKDAIEKLKKLQPDLITLDVEMPVMNGIETLRYLNENNYKIPVVMVSSITTEGAELTLKALDIGAIDFITKPTNIFKFDSGNKKREMIEKIKLASKVKIQNTKATSFSRTNNKSNNKLKIVSDITNKNRTNIIGIGTSTGGPKALQQIIPMLPDNINGSIFIVQHMPPGFTKSLANRLNNISNLYVKEAEDHEIVKKGYCYIAPGDKHMTLEQKTGKIIIKLLDTMPISGHKPSVDVLFESISKLTDVNKMGVILTGMGSDGANGIKMIKQKNGFTIAQSEESCVVFGMPKVAINYGVIDKIVNLNRVSEEIINKVGVL